MENEEINAFFNQKAAQLNDVSNNNKDSLIKIKYQDSPKLRKKAYLIKSYAWIKPLI